METKPPLGVGRVAAILFILLITWGVAVPRMPFARPFLTLPSEGIYITYEWLNKTQMIYICSQRRSLQVWFVDVLTSNRSLMITPTQELAKLCTNNCQLSGWQVSFDRRRLLARNESEGQVCILGLAEPNMVKIPLVTSDAEVHWLPRDSGIAEFERKNDGFEIHVYQLDGSSVGEPISTPFRLGFPTAFLSRDSSLVTCQSSNGLVEVKHMTLSPKVRALDSLKFKVPRRGVEESPVFSPNGERLAFVGAYERPFSLNPVRRRSLFVANLLSNSVCHIDLPGVEEDISDPRWVSSNEVSFLSGRNVYLVAPKF
jgi:hypothetical protein